MPRKLIPRPALLLGAALLALAGGCLPPFVFTMHEREHAEIQRRLNAPLPDFDEAEYTPFEKAGTGAIVGLAGYKTKEGIYAGLPGTEVTLDPVTSYSRAWWEGPALLSDKLPPDPRFEAHRRTTTLDSDGEFRFDGLPTGTYYIRTKVTAWNRPVESEGRQQANVWGGNMIWTRINPPHWRVSVAGKAVTVSGGHTLHVVVCDDSQNSTTRCGWVQEPQP